MIKSRPALCEAKCVNWMEYAVFRKMHSTEDQLPPIVDSIQIGLMTKTPETDSSDAGKLPASHRSLWCTVSTTRYSRRNSHYVSSNGSAASSATDAAGCISTTPKSAHLLLSVEHYKAGLIFTADPGFHRRHSVTEDAA